MASDHFLLFLGQNEEDKLDDEEDAEDDADVDDAEVATNPNLNLQSSSKFGFCSLLFSLPQKSLKREKKMRRMLFVFVEHIHRCR